MPYYPPAPTGGGGGSNTPADNVFRIQDNADATKQIAFEASTVATGTTRTATMPNADGTLTLLGNASTGSGNVVLGTGPTIVTPTIAATGWTNANHAHAAANSGGVLDLSTMIPGCNSSAYAWIYDDFVTGSSSSSQFGVYSWTLINGTNVTQKIAGRPGVLRRDCSTTASTVATTGLSVVFDQADTFDLLWGIRLNQSDGNTVARFGLGLNGSTGNNPPSDGMWTEKAAADTNWFGVCRASSTQTRADLGVATGTGWVNLRVRRIDASTIGFTATGGTEQTIATNLPTNTLVPFCHITNNGAAASKTVDLDLFQCLISGLSR